MVRNLVSICFGGRRLGHTKKTKSMKLETVNSQICSILIFLKIALGQVFPTHFEHGISRKMFLMLYSNNWPNFISWLLLLLEISGLDWGLISDVYSSLDWKGLRSHSHEPVHTIFKTHVCLRHTLQRLYGVFPCLFLNH